MIKRLKSTGGLLAVGYLLLALAVGGTLWRQSAPVPEIPLELARARPDTATAARAPGRPALFFIFNPVDCPECLRLGRHWNSAFETGSAEVLGVAVTGVRDSASRARLGRRLGYAYPIVLDERRGISRVLLALGQDTTPVTVLADAARRPVLIIPPLRDSTDHVVQARIVKRQIEELRRRS